MDPETLETLQLIGRWLLTLAISSLVTRHVITQDQGSHLAVQIVHYAPTLIPLAWGLWRLRKVSIRERIKMLVALMPGVHTEDQVNAIISSGEPTPALTTPSNTVPGVPK